MPLKILQTPYNTDKNGTVQWFVSALPSKVACVFCCDTHTPQIFCCVQDTGKKDENNNPVTIGHLFAVSTKGIIAKYESPKWRKIRKKELEEELADCNSVPEEPVPPEYDKRCDYSKCPSPPSKSWTYTTETVGTRVVRLGRWVPIGRNDVYTVNENTKVTATKVIYHYYYGGEYKFDINFEYDNKYSFIFPSNSSVYQDEIFYNKLPNGTSNATMSGLSEEFRATGHCLTLFDDGNYKIEDKPILNKKD